MNDMNDMNDDRRPDLIERIRALPRPGLEPAADARIYAQARAAFLAASWSGATPTAAAAARGRWSRVWNRTLEPILVVGAVAGYLTWTATALAAIDWGRGFDRAVAARAARSADTR